MAAPQFSIVIPAYNYAHFLPRSVMSALSQHADAFEVVVIDDGSTDDTPQVMQDILRQHPQRLRYIRQENQGPGAARAHGSQLARGEWLLFLDADDELYPEALHIFSQAMASHPQARVLLAGHHAVSDKHSVAITPGTVTASREHNFIAYLEKKIRFSNGASLVHLSALAQLNFCEDLKHTEDIPVFAQLLANNDAAATDTPVLRVFKHVDSRRNDYQAALSVGMTLVGRIFDTPGLPAWAAAHRTSYQARRALSLMRLALRSKQPSDARQFYYVAFRADWRLALEPRHLRLLLKSLLT